MDVVQFFEQIRDGNDTGPFIGNAPHREFAYLSTSRHRFQQAADAVPADEKPLHLLDIGPTPFTLYLKNRFPHYAVYALDRTPFLHERFARYDVDLRFCDLDHDSLPFDDGLFDVVVFMEVLEHVFRPPSDVLAEVLRILRPGGRLLLSVPNFLALRNRLCMLVGKSPLPPPDHQLSSDIKHGHGHLHEYSMEEIVKLLKNVGFEIDRRRYVRLPVFDAFRNTHWPIRQRFKHALYRALQALWPSFGCFLLLECRKPL